MEFWKSLLRLIRLNNYFFIPYFALLFLGLISVIVQDKGDAVLLFNEFHSSELDNFNVFLSFIGEGSVFLVLLLFLGFYKFRFFFKGLVSFLVAVAVTGILKLIFDMNRPALFFRDILGDLNLVEGVRLNRHLAFPSGHTTAGFSMMIFLSIIIPQKKLKLVFVFFAVLIGLSRVYLLQHFLQDVVVGSMIGCFTALIVVHWIQQNEKITKSKWYNFSLYEYIFKK